MREINRELCRAFFNSYKLKRQNSEVIITPHGVVMIYHKSAIAQLNNKYLRLTLAGYDTRTTKDRINSILAYADAPYKVVHRNGVLTLLTFDRTEERDYVVQQFPFGARDMLLFRDYALSEDYHKIRFEERILYRGEGINGETEGEAPR